MKKIFLHVIFILSINLAFAQWVKITSIPSGHIIALAQNNGQVYAESDSNIIYRSVDGFAWDPISVSNVPVRLRAMEFYNDEIYIGTADVAVFHSADNGLTWHNNSSGALPVSRFAVKDGTLLAATVGDGVIALDTRTDKWVRFNNSLPFYSFNVQSIISSPDFLIIGAGSNGTFYRYNFSGNKWNEEYYVGSLQTGLQINRLISNSGTIWAVNGQRLIRSNDNGVTWAEDRTGTREGADRNIYAGPDKYYTLTNLFGGGTWIQQRAKDAAINSTWATDEELFPGGFSFDIIQFNNKLLLAKDDGLYIKTPAIILPIRFIAFNAKCEPGKVELTWKAVQQGNSSVYGIERSADGTHWTSISNLPVTGNGENETSYSFTENNAPESSYYRIATHEPGGRVQYSTTIRSSCSLPDLFSLGPNPVHDITYINILSAGSSQALIKVFDSKGVLVKTQRANILKGSNQVSVDMNLLASGVYNVSVNWHMEQFHKAMWIVKK